MVSCCANPPCRIELKLLNGGDLYALERRSADTEFFWLCSACVPIVALRLDAMAGVSARPRSDAPRPHPPHSASSVSFPVLHGSFGMAPGQSRPGVDAFNQIRGNPLFIMQPTKPRNYSDTP